MDLIYAERIPHREPQRGLGRHIRHDPRSRLYRVPRREALVSVQHSSKIGVLDQGDLGQCTGAAALKCMSYEPFYSQLNKRFAMFNWTIAQATNIYSLNTQNDTFPGAYPPEDTGSDGLASGDTLKKLGWVSGYVHGFSLNDLVSALQVGPVSMGSNWYSSMSAPTSAGEVRVTTGAYLEGGHQFCLDGVDVTGQKIWGQQSWGPSWGPLGGRFWMSYKTVQRLLSESGDVISYVPLSEPAPQPEASADGGSAQELYDQIKLLAGKMGLKA